VTYGDKEENVATKSTGERDGWLFVSAKNFTYSSPSIEVALSQPKASPTPTPSATSTASPATKKAVSKKTISCIKGSTVKKVTATSPKCPAGFKKRS